MITWTDYFAAMAILFMGYIGIRCSLVYYLHSLPPLPREPVDSTGKAIETRDLAERLGEVRENFSERHPKSSESPQRAVVMESKRAQLAKLSFFHAPTSPTSEPRDDQHGLSMLMV